MVSQQLSALRFDTSVSAVVAEALASVGGATFTDWVETWQENHFTAIAKPKPWINESSARAAFGRAGANELYCNDMSLRVIVDFFDGPGNRPELASRIRSTFMQVARRHGVAYDPHPRGHTVHGKLSWLLEPTVEPDSSEFAKFVREWRLKAEHGAEPLYDHAKAAFVYLQESHIHQPYLARLANDLAAVEVTYGDYGDAFATAQWLEAYFLKTPDVDLPDNLYTDLHRVFREVTSARTYGLFDEEFSALALRYDQVRNSILRDEKLNGIDQARLLKHAQRSFARHAVTYRFRALTYDLVDIGLVERQGILEQFDEDIRRAEAHHVETTGLDLDTRARVLGVLVDDPEGAEDAQEKAKVQFEQEAAEIAEIVDNPRLFDLWKIITAAMVGMATGITRKDPALFKKAIGGLDDLRAAIRAEDLHHGRHYDALLRGAMYRGHILSEDGEPDESGLVRTWTRIRTS